MSRTLEALTVSEVIEILKSYDPNTKVAVSCDYGDYCHTQQVIPLQENDIGIFKIRESAYSRSRFALDEHDEDDYDEDDYDEDEDQDLDEEQEKVLVFRY